MMKKLREDIERTLNDERDNLEKYGEHGNCEGWIEALEYVKGQIDAMQMEAVFNTQEGEEE